MKNLKRAAPSIVFAVVCVLTFAWIVVESDSFEKCQADYSKKASQQQQPKSTAIAFPRTIVVCTGKFLHEAHAEILSVFTVLLAFFTGTLWWATRNLVNHAGEIERAYISIGGCAFTEPEFFQLVVNNWGKTPGTVSHISIVICEKNALPEVPKYEQGKYFFGLPVQPGIRNENARAPIMKWRHFKEPVVYARVWYEDIFHNQHTDGFIYSIDAVGGTNAIEAPRAYSEWS